MRERTASPPGEQAARFAHNPFTRCSCWLCSASDAERRAERRRRERAWRAEL